MGWIDLGQAWGSGDEDVPTEAEYRAQQAARGHLFYGQPAQAEETEAGKCCRQCGKPIPVGRGAKCNACYQRPYHERQRRLAEKARV